MTQARLLLVVSEAGSITDVARSARRVTYQAVADKIGAELLVTAEGCGAQLLDVPLAVAAEAEADDVVGRDCRGNPTYSEKARAAFRLVERLVNAGEVKLAPDRWVQGALRFQPPGASVVVEPLSVPCTLQSFVGPERTGLCPPSVVFGVVIGVILTGVVGAVLHLTGL